MQCRNRMHGKHGTADSPGGSPQTPSELQAGRYPLKGYQQAYSANGLNRIHAHHFCQRSGAFSREIGRQWLVYKGFERGA